jgi:predicted helicase
MKLREKGFTKVKWDNERLGIYLTNTLEEAKPDIKKLELVKWLSDEAEAAQKVKTNTPVMVVLGNPPYNLESQNKYSSDIYSTYKKEPGGIENLNERNKKCLNDDYVKFLAYGHSLISKYQEGVLAYINNNGFLDNPTFRGMRWSLLNTFDKIYVINLYGDVEKNKLIDDKDDKNVFDITKGVSINIFVKNNKKKPNELADVFYSEIRGSRSKKFDYLNKNICVNNIKWKKLTLNEDNFYLMEKEFKNEISYKEYFGINEIFKTFSSGIDTGRDDFAINADKEELIKNIDYFLTLDNEKAREELKLGDDSRDWKIEYVKNDLITNIQNNKKPDYSNIVELQYKPFDIRYTYYTGRSRGFHINPRNSVMKHFIIGKNYGLIFNRGIIGKITPSFITNKIILGRSWSRSGTTSRDYVTPLFIYTYDNDTEKQNNWNMDIISKIESILVMKLNDNEKDNNSFSSLDMLDYIYSFLHSVTYREKYNELLNIDFPRIKYPKDKNEFKLLVEIGSKLRKLHLMEELDNIKDIITYPEGADEIEKIRYEDNKVFINPKQFFANISPEIWEYYIGGYQPANQWLKEKKGKKLEYNDIKHFNKIIYIIQETIKIQKQIDEILANTNW